MTKEEFDTIKAWDYITNGSGVSYVVMNKKDNGVDVMCASSTSFQMYIPINEMISRFNVTGTKFTPPFEMVNHFIKLYKCFENEKPDGVYLNHYIKDNWNNGTKKQ